MTRLGVGVTTHNRSQILASTLKKIRSHTPEDAVIVVVDDASRRPVKNANYRFEENVGVARAKNKCLELLYNAGCEHIFLFDDDAYPLVEDWWVPYVESPEPHLMAIFSRPSFGPHIIYEDDQHIAYHATRGHMLYVERRVLDAVGGMDPRFGRWGWEHESWSDRIHAAGFTTWRYADVRGSEELIYSMDVHGEVKSTATSTDRMYAQNEGEQLRLASRNSTEYIEFRDLDDVVITCLLTAHPDPQRGRHMDADPRLLRDLHDSLQHFGRFIVLHTHLDEDKAEIVLPTAEFHRVPQYINPYFERWVAIYRWLRDNPDVGRVWCVDGTDVKMLRDPFPEMEPGTLYTGYEPKTLRCPWMIEHHPDTTLQDFMRDNANLPLLNAGVMGGPRDLVMRFAWRMTKMYFDDHIDDLMLWERQRVNSPQAGDMGCFNYIARTEFADVLSTGPHVTTVFKLEERRNQYAWWKHK